MVLIGLIGYKNAGKDTLADYLVRNHGFEKHAFADPVKQVCGIMFDLTPKQLTDPEGKETVDERWGMTPRKMMQTVGTDMVRAQLGNDFWVRHMNARMRHKEKLKIVISDVRFPNEAEWVRQNGGVLVRVIDGTQHADCHPSETEQLSIHEDARIFNHKTNIEEFHREAASLLPAAWL